jgi:LEA14-like dessication related protein
MKRYLILLSGTVLILCAACASKPAPAVLLQPGHSLAFDRIEAEDPEHISLYFFLKAENPRSSGMSITMEDWALTLNDKVVEKGALINLETAYLESGDSGIFPVRLDLENPALILLSEDTDFSEYKLQMRLDMDFAFEGGDSVTEPVIGEARFPRIREPVFTITSISVMRAELINTRLKIKVRIDNPNVFPVDLSSFAYELYGAGRFWADGIVKDVMHIAPRASTERDLFLIMNFINMKRDLLDQVITLQSVNYRFAGESAVSTGIEYLPRFRMDFDRIGNSPVVE